MAKVGNDLKDHLVPSSAMAWIASHQTHSCPGSHPILNVFMDRELHNAWDRDHFSLSIMRSLWEKGIW